MANDVVVNRAVKRFGRVTALDAISFSSRKGINIILGPNGAGKSTLLRSISGLYELEGGTISVLGSNPYTDTDLRRRVSFLADNYGLYDFLSVRKNLGFFGKFYLFTAVLAMPERSLGLIWLVVLAVAMSAVSLYYYLQVLKRVYVVEPAASAGEMTVSKLRRVLVAVLSLAVVALGAAPNLLLRFIAVQ